MKKRYPLPQDPTAYLRTIDLARDSFRLLRAVLNATVLSRSELVSVPPSSSVTNTRTPTRLWTPHGPRTALDHSPQDEPRKQRPVLLRKEVIQPHLPVRLPCYDLAPVTCSTLTGFCDEHQLQVYQTFMA